VQICRQRRFTRPAGYPRIKVAETGQEVPMPTTSRPSRKPATPARRPGAAKPPKERPAAVAAEVSAGPRAGVRPAPGAADPPDSARLVSEARAGLGVTREFFARMAGFSVRAIAGWEAGRPLSEPGRRRIAELRRLGEALAAGMKSEYIARWLDTPCEALGGMKPVEVLERGEADRLWRTVLLIGSGMPT
jgi:transcriptional regulator with XRE-family HTH domain